MDPNQILGIAADTFNSLDPKSKEALTYPSARTLGNAADGLISLVFYPLLKAQIFTHEKLKQYRKEVSEKISHIPENNRDTSKFGLVLKAIEESRYQLNEDDIRKLYVNLIASTVDNRKNNVVNPRLATVVSQFGGTEADLLNEIHLSKNRSLQTAEIWAFSDNHAYNYKASQRFTFAHGKPTLKYHSSIDVLKSLGVINATNKRKLEGNYYKQIYNLMNNNIKSSKYYLNINNSLNENEHLEFMPSYITLTDFGVNLCRCIFE